jgi:hypothetical protein
MEKVNEQNTPVNFTTVDPTSMKFSEEFKCAKSTAGQVVVGLRWLSNTVSSSKEATNDYQKKLYPTITQLANEVCDKYMETFVSGVSEPLQVQVYGANLNGRLNDGRLKHDIPCKNTDRRARYKYSQLGQLLSLLYDRLLFISHRDVNKIPRYVENADERKHFESLQQLCAQFCNYLRGDDNSIMSRWTTFVNSSRQSFNVQSKTQNQEASNRGRGRNYEHAFKPEKRENQYSRLSQNSRGGNRGTGRSSGYETDRGTERGRTRGRGFSRGGRTV